jgi:hypothetical protein
VKKELLHLLFSELIKSAAVFIHAVVALVNIFPQICRKNTFDELVNQPCKNLSILNG